MTLLALSMYFDTEDGYNQETYPDLTPDEIVMMMKEDFLDTILKQWSWEELMETIVVMED
jgi:hypothetical protein